MKGDWWGRHDADMRVKGGDLFALSCASCLRVCLGNSFSVSSTSGNGKLSILLFVSVARCCVTACV